MAWSPCNTGVGRPSVKRKKDLALGVQLKNSQPAHLTPESSGMFEVSASPFHKPAQPSSFLIASPSPISVPFKSSFLSPCPGRLNLPTSTGGRPLRSVWNVTPLSKVTMDREGS